jgi:hypothetical protein
MVAGFAKVADRKDFLVAGAPIRAEYTIFEHSAGLVHGTAFEFQRASLKNCQMMTVKI